jgi:hypothetical protein
MILLVEDNDDDRDLAMLAFKQAKAPGEPMAVDFVELVERIGSYWVRFNQVAPAYAA